MKSNGSQITTDTFKATLDIIVPGWTIGVCILTLPILLLASPAILFFGTSTTEEKVYYLSCFVLIPIIAFFQSILISLLCYIGLKVYHWNKRRRTL